MATDKMSICFVMAVCLCAVTSALSVGSIKAMTMDNASESMLAAMELEEVEVLKTALEDLKQLFDGRTENGHCSCGGLSCRCCQIITIKKLHLYTTVCLEARFRPLTASLKVALTIAGKTIYVQEFPVARPTSSCFKYKIAKVCLKFYGYAPAYRRFVMCTRTTFSIFGIQVGKFDLGCFRIDYLDSTMPLLESAEGQTVDGTPIAEDLDGSLYLTEENLDEADKVFGQDPEILKI